MKPFPDATLIDLRASVIDSELPRQRQEAALQLLATLRRPTVTFLMPGPGTYEINGQGLASDLRGMAAAWDAIAHPGEAVVRAADHAEQGVQHPDGSVRQGLKRAADLLDRYSPALANVVRRLRVEAGFVRHHPSPQVDVITHPTRSSGVRAIAAVDLGLPNAAALPIMTMRTTIYTGGEAIAAAVPGTQVGGMHELFGKHIAVVIESDDILLGYTVNRIAPLSLLFGGTPAALNLAIQAVAGAVDADIHPTLIAETERAVRKHGAVKMVWAAVPDSPLEALLARLGYQAEAARYVSR